MSDILQKINDYCLEDLMGDSFGAYSKYIIQDRAIPDVRDGLKPVQRRILFAMYKNKNFFERPYVKAALTVGDVIGKYHPHGDTSVYDALVRMSQDWKQRFPSIDFKGNNGSIDGDPAAAYRYTETRLAKLSNEILKDIDKDTVIMAPTFDDSRVEPTVMPCRFPNLLVNGTTGISAGYATNIPPHNLGEVIDATIKRIDSPDCRLDTILDIIKGPDFPTGGSVYGKDGIRSAFETGKGKIIVRGTYEIIKNKGKEQIVITEIPFDVNKANLVYKITEIKIDKKIDGIAEVADESDINGLKITIDLKSGADANLIINYLLKNTELQINYNYNIVAIVNRRPKQLGVLGILDAYIAHQKDVITRKTKFNLDFASSKLHIIEGLIKAMSILDAVIKTIRASKNKANAIDNLVKEYDFSFEQAKAIVEMQLYRLTNTDVEELMAELENLRKVIEFLNSILSNEEVLKKVIKDDLRKIKKEYDLPRITEIFDEAEDIKIDIKETIIKENVVVVVTNEGYIKRVSSKSYALAEDETALKPGDYVTGLYELTTLDTVILFTNLGHYLFVPVHIINEAKWKEMGKHISNLIPISPEEKVIASLVLNNPADEIIMFSKNGSVKRSILKDFIVSRYSKPMVAMKLKDNDVLVSLEIKSGDVILVTNNGYYLRFDSNEIPVVGVKASGVKGINLKDDELVAGLVIDNQEYLDVFTNQKTAKRIKISDLVRVTRAKKGNMLIKKVKTVDYKIENAILTDSKAEIGLKIESDISVIKNSDIPIMDLASTGSAITKKKPDETFLITELVSFNKKDTPKKEESIEIFEEKIEIKVDNTPKELTIDDFINDFKL